MTCQVLKKKQEKRKDCLVSQASGEAPSPFWWLTIHSNLHSHFHSWSPPDPFPTHVPCYILLLNWNLQNQHIVPLVEGILRQNLFLPEYSGKLSFLHTIIPLAHMWLLEFQTLRSLLVLLSIVVLKWYASIIQWCAVEGLRMKGLWLCFS